MNQYSNPNRNRSRSPRFRGNNKQNRIGLEDMNNLNMNPMSNFHGPPPGMVPFFGNNQMNHPPDGRIVFNDCMLMPPRPEDPAWVPNGVKPPFCRTIYVGGIPPFLCPSRRLENNLHDVFKLNGGEIQSISRPTSGHCYIRFKKEGSVDLAMTVLGYYMLLQMEGGRTASFRLMVKYSESHEDREEVQKKDISAKKLKILPEELPDIPQFCNSTSDKVLTNLKDYEKHQESVIILRSWLNSQVIDKNNSLKFYTMLQGSYVQVRNLLDQNKQLDEEYKTVLHRYSFNNLRIDEGLNSLTLLYKDTMNERVLDKFTKLQHKAISSWLDEAKDGITMAEKRKSQKENSASNDKSENNKDVKSTNKEETIDSLRIKLQDMQQQAWDLIVKVQSKDSEIKQKDEEISNLKNELKELDETSEKETAKRKIQDKENLNQKDSKLICVLPAFLRLFPHGAPTDTILFYLKEHKIHVASANDLEILLLKLNDVFSLKMCIEDGKATRKWKLKINN